MSRTRQLDCRRVARADRGTGHLSHRLVPFPWASPPDSGSVGSIPPPNAAPDDNLDVAYATVGLSPGGASGQGDRSSVAPFGSLPVGQPPPDSGSVGSIPPQRGARRQSGCRVRDSWIVVGWRERIGGQVICRTVRFPSRGPAPPTPVPWGPSPPNAAPDDNLDVAYATVELSPGGASGQGDRSSVAPFGSLPVDEDCLGQRRGAGVFRGWALD
jgi:hypothetical protein